MGAGPLWVSQAFHITSCASEENKGIYNGIFFCTFACSYISSNILAGTLIDSVELSSFYWIMAGVALLGSLSFSLVRTPKEYDQVQDAPEQEKSNNTVEIDTK